MLRFVTSLEVAFPSLSDSLTGSLMFLIPFWIMILYSAPSPCHTIVQKYKLPILLGFHCDFSICYEMFPIKLGMIAFK